MTLGRKDAATTVVAAAVLVVYLLFRSGTDAWLVSGVRGSTVAVLVLGMLGCTIGSGADLYAEPRRGSTGYTVVATILGLGILVSGVLALVTGAAGWLTVLVGAVLALWLVATARHALAGPSTARRRPGEGGRPPAALGPRRRHGPRTSTTSSRPRR